MQRRGTVEGCPGHLSTDGGHGQVPAQLCLDACAAGCRGDVESTESTESTGQAGEGRADGGGSCRWREAPGFLAAE